MGFQTCRASLNHLIWEGKIKRESHPHFLQLTRLKELELRAHERTSPKPPRENLQGSRGAAQDEPSPCSPRRRVPDAPAWPRARLSPPSQTRTASSAAPSPGGSWCPRPACVQFAGSWPEEILKPDSGRKVLGAAR